ncbi:MAG TPA: PQQ-dependent sugar dehydrogenase, partial [Stellaceae bacterium]|nr:PQQ-dependent sugar dehydrogenase [Stellaceae bacterium]
MRTPVTIAAIALSLVAAATLAADPPKILTGADAFGDWHADTPGTLRKITVADLPAPFATGSARESARVVAPPRGAHLATLPRFSAAVFADHLDHPRQIRVAPNGDIFVAESRADRIRLLRAPEGAGKLAQNEVFATKLDSPFGIAFWPPGSDPRYVYVANTTSIVRFPYKSGDLKASGPAETIVSELAQSGGHWTRDIVFSSDGKTMFVSVGSGSNDAEGMPRNPPGDWVASHPLGAAWDSEAGRADVLAFDPEGKNRRIYATGLRNCVSLALAPKTGEPWCAVNERDGLGDNLPPDYLTRVRQGG